MSESTITIMNQGIASMASATGSIQDEVLAKIEKRLKTIQDGLKTGKFFEENYETYSKFR